MPNESRITFTFDDEEQERQPERTVRPPKPEKKPDPVNGKLQWGTPACGALCAVIGALVALLIIAVGFWKTLFVAALAAVGAFIGAVPNKGRWLRDTINRLFPPRDKE